MPFPYHSARALIRRSLRCRSPRRSASWTSATNPLATPWRLGDDGGQAQDRGSCFLVRGHEDETSRRTAPRAIQCRCDSRLRFPPGPDAHGAYPHQGKDPIVIGAQITINLQTIISRELAPRHSGVITVGSFHAGTKHNIISDRAHLQLTVRSLNPEVRAQLLSAIERVAMGTARTAGLPEDKLPEVVVDEFSYPPTYNDSGLARRLKGVLVEKMGADAVIEPSETGMGAEDFGFFTTDPYIPSVYFSVGGTPKKDIERAEAGGPAIPSHHSPQFKISPEPSVKAGVEATVVVLMELMTKG